MSETTSPWAPAQADAEALAKLREPFKPEQIGKLPKPYKRDSTKGKCNECGGYHGLPAAHLDYVGHAATTDRLIEADPAWTWEPVAFGDDGLPKLDSNGGLWIRLTVAGVTRLGYGDAQGKQGPNAVKEVIGDAIRNAAMRFGVALDLWSKEDLAGAQDQAANREWVSEAEAAENVEDVKAVWRAAKDAGADVGTLDKIAVIGRERKAE